MRIALLANSARYLWNFRMNLRAALVKDGHEVIAVSPGGADRDKIVASDCRHRSISLTPDGKHPWYEWLSVRELRSLLRQERIDLVLSSTPKCNLYAALARDRATTRQIANVSGLGSGHLRQDWVTRVMNTLYARTFPGIDWVFFENGTDHDHFCSRRWSDPERCETIPGLGVNLAKFSPDLAWSDEAAASDFLMVARVIADKGVRELIEAGRIVRLRHPNVRLLLLGEAGAENPSAIPPTELAQWVAEGLVVHQTHVDDVRPFMSRALCVVLPSYREGMSRTLLEGAAMGRPLIATDVPGCREAIDGTNGFLCAPRSSHSLAEAMLRFISLSPSDRHHMGLQSRRVAEERFSETAVIDRYLERIRALERSDPRRS